MTDWEEFEQQTRHYASIKFGCSFIPDRVAGTNFDSVGNVDADQKVIIEITKNHTLDKVRGDLNRLVLARNSLFGRGIYVKGIVILDKTPTPAMREAAKELNFKVYSLEEFVSEWHDPRKYAAARIKKPFGSAFQDGEIGPDKRDYVPVLLEDQSGRPHSIEDVCRRIKNGAKIVLTGDFGTGKSRAIQQVFEYLRPNKIPSKSPLSIDLRTMWGTQTAEEMVRRHYTSLYLGDAAGNALEALQNGQFYLLLDGFDELAIQAWGVESDDISRSRYRVMDPIRDILNLSTNGALITGRAHYFNNNDEMLTALGLQPDTLVLSTPPEFSVDEAKEFLNGMGFGGALPSWLPRKPLIAELYAKLAVEIYDEAAVERHTFWENFIESICARDSKIRESYDPEVIKNILRKLSRSVRNTRDGRGPISPNEVQEAFASIVGQLPAQEASSMLQRLPGLGRVASETDDRQFVDDFIVEGLRGLDVASIISNYEMGVDSSDWKHGAGELGLQVLSGRLGTTFTWKDAKERMREEQRSTFSPLAADICAAVLLSEEGDLDFGGISVSGGFMSVCSLSENKVKNLSIAETEIEYLNAFNADLENVTVSDCTVQMLDGAAGEGTPEWMHDCHVEEKSSLDTVSRIKRTGLSPAQMILVTILRKTYFQPGRGRKEEALLRGLGEFGDTKLQGKILKLLISNGFMVKDKGDTGYLYIPERSKKSRASRMMSQLQQSKDEVWELVSDL